MDLTTTPTPTTTPDTDNDTPPHTQQVKHFPYSNGTLKKHHYPYHHHKPPFGVAVGIYRECMKNHAASLGGHALDGCGEFMASSTANPLDPTSLKCAACGCHRNFHRREPDGYSPPHTIIPHFLDFRHPGRSSPSPSPPPPHTQSFAPQMLLALSSAASEDQQGHNQNHHQVVTPVTPTAAKSENLSGRKRFRTKFTQEQKEKMHSFSEKLGWKLQKCDEARVEDFCNEIGVARGVLKVWMHNNKNTLGKKDIITNTNGTPTSMNNDSNNNASGTRVSFGNGSSYNMNRNINNNEEEEEEEEEEEDKNNGSHYQNENRDTGHLHASTNGSSSS